MNLENFCKELQELSIKHGIAFPSEIKLIPLNPEEYQEGTLKYDIAQEISYANGTKDKCGPFLISEMQIEKKQEQVEKLNVNISIGDPHRLFSSKKLPSDYKELINYCAKTNPKSTMHTY